MSKTRRKRSTRKRVKDLFRRHSWEWPFWCYSLGLTSEAPVPCLLVKSIHNINPYNLHSDTNGVHLTGVWCRWDELMLVKLCCRSETAVGSYHLLSTILGLVLCPGLALLLGDHRDCTCFCTALVPANDKLLTQTICPLQNVPTWSLDATIFPSGSAVAHEDTWHLKSEHSFQFQLLHFLTNSLLISLRNQPKEARVLGLLLPPWTPGWSCCFPALTWSAANIWK